MKHQFSFDPTYGYDLPKLLSLHPGPGPADLDAFWQGYYAKALATAPKPELTPCNQILPGYDVHCVSFNSWDGFRVGGWFIRPKEAKPEHLMIYSHGYGGRDGANPPHGKPAIAIFPCARGQGTRSVHKDFPQDVAQHVVAGIQSRHTYIHLGCVMDHWAAVNALLELAGEEYAKSLPLHYFGGSFGGGMGAIALAWDKRFAAGGLEVPSFGNQALRITMESVGSGEAVRKYYLKHPEVMDELQYFDSAIIARRISVPVHVTCALFDPAVCPPGQFSVYNTLGELAGKPVGKQLRVRLAGHFGYPTAQQEDRNLFREVGEFLSQHG